MQHLLALGTMLGWSLLFARVAGRKFSVLGSVLLLITACFISAVVGQFQFFSTVIIWAGNLYAGYTVVRNGTQTERIKDFRQLLPPWLLIFTLAYFVSRGAVNWAWDEFTHWGTQVEYLRIFGELLGDPSLLIFADYIPGMSLWRSFFRSQLADSGMAAAYFADWVLILACIHTLSQGKKLPEKLALWCFLACLWVIFFQSLILTLYVDQLQAILLLTGLALVALEAPKTLLCLLLVVLTTTKHVGLLFALGIAAYYGGHAILVKKRAIRQSLGDTLLVALCPILAWGLWSAFVRINGISPSMEGGLSTELGRDYHHMFSAFLRTLGDILSSEYPHAWFLKNPWAPDFAFSVQILFALATGLLLLPLLKSSESRAHDAFDLVFSMALVTLYTLFLAAVWSLIPGGADKASNVRYLSVPLMGLLAYLYWRKCQFGRPWQLLPGSVLILAIPGAVLLAPPYDALFGKQKPGLAIQREYQHIVAGVRQHIKPNETIWYLIEAAHAKNYFIFRSALLPQHLVDWHLLTNLTLGQNLPEWPALKVRQELLGHRLCEADFVYTGQLSDTFWNDYRASFDIEKNEALYRIKRKDAATCSASLVWSSD